MDGAPKNIPCLKIETWGTRFCDSFQIWGQSPGVVLWRFKEEQMSRSGCASTPAFGREEAPIGAAFTARLKPCPSGLVARRVDCWRGEEMRGF
jgi:hypothetical protein